MLWHDSSSACNYSKKQVSVAKAILEIDDPESILDHLHSDGHPMSTILERT